MGPRDGIHFEEVTHNFFGIVVVSVNRPTSVQPMASQVSAVADGSDRASSDGRSFHAIMRGKNHNTRMITTVTANMKVTYT